LGAGAIGGVADTAALRTLTIVAVLAAKTVVVIRAACIPNTHPRLKGADAALFAGTFAATECT